MSAGNELSRLLLVDPLAEGGLDFALDASERERAGLTRRFDLVAIEGLHASGTVTRGPMPSSIVVEGRLVADAVQTCVATLEPVPEHVEAEFRRLFVLGDHGDDDEVEIELDPLDDPPEPLAGPMLDIGEVVAEELSLSLDPYPRAPGAEGLPALRSADNGGGGPFAALARRRGS
ncbi:MAG TPA: DUF177 domain-containing protein [Geminicoccaceae bacterium]|nr:DUF177 domain-containing protein [Geminicoccus sp.]HMU53234.1 DUF177 domain-containing protein [Geminicoccaceae bacterium]